MFSCQICGRDYGNRSSLTRHSHNHKKTTKHKCSICGTVFFRRDLLSRHLRMHESLDFNSPPPAASASSVGSDMNHRHQASRKRCHTACVQCRTSRTKCDGQSPCAVCTRNGKLCSYAPKSQRISQPPAVRESKRQRLSQEEQLDDAVDYASSSTESVESYHAAPDTATDRAPPDLPANFLGSPNSGGTSIYASYPTQNLTDMTQIARINAEVITTRMGNSNFNDFDGSSAEPLGDATTWAWMHENMFLYPESNGQWPVFQQNIAEQPIGPASQDASFGSYDPFFEIAIPQPNQQSLTQSEDFVGANRTEYLGGDLQSSIQDHEEVTKGDETDTRSGTTTLPMNRTVNQSESSEVSFDSENGVIEELVEYASSPNRAGEDRNTRADYWRSMSRPIQKTFRLGKESSNNSLHLLQSLVKHYLKYFGPLWPLLGMQNFDMDMLHPVLYLTLTSIGAMYSGPEHCTYGRMMHECIRKKLLATAFEIDNLDDDFLWLGQARLLTQVAALYFGQKQAFSYAQHLGGILVAQARRMDLFSAQAQQNLCLQSCHLEAGEKSCDERLAKWIYFEERKRLAFGILRAESYSSVLLNTRPFISSEEINLEFPCDEGVWASAMPSPSAYLEAVKRDRNLGGMPFSDIVRITMDRAEPIPSLEPICQELLLFGLQNAAWRFCHDPGLFKRLTGKINLTSRPEYLGLPQTLHDDGWRLTTSLAIPPSGSTAELPEIASYPDHLAAPRRGMDDLRLDCDRLFLALRKWKQAFEAGRTLNTLRHARNSILSSLLLYHTTYLRLHAPIPKLHLISYQLAGKRVPPESAVSEVREWTQSLGARAAIQHALTIWSLINQESQRPLSSRAQFNFLAFAGLHHAAVAMWAYASTHNKNAGPDKSICLVPGDNIDGEGGVYICSQDLDALLDQFIRLYKSMSPARWSSFATAAINLKSCHFPSLATT